MSNVWQIGQETSASQMYDKTMFGKIFKVTVLTKMCNEMTAQFDKITDDENNYLLELDDINSEIDTMQNDLQAQVEKLRAEIAELEKKYNKGTITEEETAELMQKKSNLNELLANGNSNIKSKSEAANAKGQEVVKKHEAKVAVAKDYGETTIEKGQPLADTKVKNGFFRKLFGTTGKDKKEAGEKAVKAGNTLLEKVEEAGNLEKMIVSKKIK